MTSQPTSYLPRILGGIALLAWLLLLWPFPVTTFMAGCVACVSYPLYQRLGRRFSGSWPATIYIIGLVVLTALPIVVVVMLVTPQAVAGLRILDELRDAGWVLSPEAQAFMNTLNDWLMKIPGLEGGFRQLASRLADMAGVAARTVLAGGVGLAGSAFNAVFVMLLFVMIAVMGVTHGPVIREFTQRLSGFPEPVMGRFIQTTRKAIYGVMVGVVFVAMIQGALCGIGFAFAGVPQAAFWGLLATFVAPIPFVGTALVWLPISIWLWLTGAKTAAIALALWAALVVAGVDNILRPIFLRTGIDATLIALILSILCGLSAFGPVGIFAGPVLLAVGIQAGRESTAAAKE